LHTWINACLGTVAEAVSDHLREVQHELVVAVELIQLNADDFTGVVDADEKIASPKLSKDSLRAGRCAREEAPQRYSQLPMQTRSSENDPTRNSGEIHI
jgi:hypothetical protein